MLAWIAHAGLGAAIPGLIRSMNTAELALYQAVAEDVMRIRRDIMKASKGAFGG